MPVAGPGYFSPASTSVGGGGGPAGVKQTHAPGAWNQLMRAIGYTIPVHLQRGERSRQRILRLTRLG